jgi:hypothetical protein
MTGDMHKFDRRVAGGYRMSLFYQRDEGAFRGKTPVNVRFMELAPPCKIVEAVNFVATDPAYSAR